MACCWLVLLVISVLGLQSICEYINVTVSYTNVTWESAKNQPGCKLAGLDRNGTFDPSDINVLNHTGPLDAWVGAHVKFSPWISITGCFHQNDSSIFEHQSVDISNASNPVEACFNQCSPKVKEFALTVTKCYCLHNATYTSGKPCLGSLCGTYHNSLCGENKCMCQYKPLSSGPVLNGTGNCMTIRKIPNNKYNYIPSRCSSKHTLLCSNKNQTEITLYGTNSARSWLGALSLCEHNKQILLGLDVGSIPHHTYQLDSSISYWIGMLRFQYFYWGNSNVNDSLCVSFRLMPNDGSAPELRLKDCNTMLPVLCGPSNLNQKTPSSAYDFTTLPSSHTSNDNQKTLSSAYNFSGVSTLPLSSNTTSTSSSSKDKQKTPSSAHSVSSVSTLPVSSSSSNYNQKTLSSAHNFQVVQTIPSSSLTSNDNQKTLASAHNLSDVSTLSSTSSSSNDVPLLPIVGTTSGVLAVILITTIVCLIKRRNKHKNRTDSRHSAKVTPDTFSLP